MLFISETNLFELIQVILISGIKFLFAPFLSVGYGFTYFQTVLFTTIGGIAGVFFFYFLSKWLIQLYNKYCPVVISYFGGEEAKKRMLAGNCKNPEKKKFTRKNKVLINMRKNYGFFGIILLTPVLLSIPLGTFLAKKYYSKRSNIILYLSISVVFWSFCISTFYFLV